MLWPVVALLHRARIPYGLGAIVSILAGFGVVVGLVSVIAPSVVAQWPSLWSSAISGVRKLQAWAAEPPLNVRDEQLNDWIDQGLTWIQSHSGALLGQALSFGGSLGSGAVTLLLTLVLTFFFLKDGHRFVGFTRRVVGRKAGFHATELLTRLWNTLSGYIRTQALVSLVDAVFIGLGLVIMGVPLAIPIAVLTFMAGFIPMVGAVTAGALAVLVALVSNGLTTAVLVLVLVIAVQQLEGNILQPILQARVMQLHPAVVLLSVLLGGVWAGIIGAFIAVPVAAMIAVVLRYLGDLIDLRTGERSASDITWATDDGHTVASESERSAAFFKAIVRGRSAERNGHAGGHDDGEDRKHGGHPTWRERLLGRRPDGQAEEEPPGDGRDD